MNFSKQIKAFKDKFEKKAGEFHKELFIAISTQIVLKTPVLTGYAAGNWQTSNSVPTTSEIMRFDPTKTEAINDIISKVTSQPGQVSYLTNNADYIIDLEYGFSRKAPQGMVRVTFDNYEALFKQALGSVTKG